MKYTTFAGRITGNILLWVSILFLLVVTFFGIMSHYLMTKQAVRLVRSEMYTSKAKLEEEMTRVELATNFVSMVIGQQSRDTAFVKKALVGMLGVNENIAGITVGYVPDHFAGKHYYALHSSRGANKGYDVKQVGSADNAYIYKEWYQMPMLLGKPVWTEPYVSEDNDTVMVTSYCVPVYDEKKELVLVVTMDVSLAEVSAQVESIKPYSTSVASLVSKAGIFIIKDSKPMMGENYVMEQAEATGNKDVINLCHLMLEGQDTVLTIQEGLTGYFSVITPLRNGWAMSVACSFKSVVAEMSRLHFWTIVIGIIGLLAIALACYVMIRHKSRPLVKLTTAARSMAQGNFKPHLPEIDSYDEMLRLKTSFGYMQESISEYISELKTTTSANERMEGELNVARQIQLGMLPTDYPENLYALLNPAKEVGGDLYDFLRRESNHTLYFTVGDVSGKGVPAALVMAICRSAFRFVSGLGLNMGEVMSRVNNIVAEANKNGMFVTVFAGRIDMETGLMRYCNAGHNHIIVIPPEGEAYYLMAKANLAVGLFEDFPYEGEELQLEKGTRLILYTDGVSEAETAEKELYGDDRLLDWAKGIQQRSKTTPMSDKEVADDLYASVKAFTNGNEQNDDITIMSITY